MLLNLSFGNSNDRGTEQLNKTKMVGWKQFSEVRLLIAFPFAKHKTLEFKSPFQMTTEESVHARKRGQ